MFKIFPRPDMDFSILSLVPRITRLINFPEHFNNGCYAHVNLFMKLGTRNTPELSCLICEYAMDRSGFSSPLEVPDQTSRVGSLKVSTRTYISLMHNRLQK